MGKKIECLNDNVNEKLNEIKQKCTNLERKDVSLRRSLRKLVTMKDFPSAATLNSLKKEFRLPKNFYNKLYFHCNNGDIVPMTSNEEADLDNVVVDTSNSRGETNDRTFSQANGCCSTDYRKLVAEDLGAGGSKEYQDRIPTPDYDDHDETESRKISAISIESTDDLKTVMESDETWYRGD